MATAESASATLGPRYAPDDPSLPKPWKGLIDGSTGLLYYWNPETNVTQYERPGPPPVVSTPKLSPLPAGHLVQSNGGVAQVAQQQATQQHGQQLSQLPPQHGQVIGQQQSSTVAQVSDQQGSHQQAALTGHAMQQPGQFASLQIKPQMMYHPVQQMVSPMRQQMPQPAGQHVVQQQGQQMLQKPGQTMQQQVTYQMPQKLGQQAGQHQNQQMIQPQGHQYAHAQLHFLPYPQSTPPQAQQTSQQQTQLGGQGLQHPNQQEFKTAFPRREEVDFQQGNKTGFSPSQFQQLGASSSQNLPNGNNLAQMSQTAVHPHDSQLFAGSSISMQQPTAMVHMQQTSTELVHQQNGPRFHNQMNPAIMHKQQSNNMPPSGFNTGYEDNLHGRAGNDNHNSNSKQGPVMGLQQPKLAPIPMMRNEQEMRMGGVPPHNNMPAHHGGLNVASGHALHNMISHGHGPHGGPPYPNNAPMKPHFGGPLDAEDLSSADAYRKQHEVMAKGDNVPAPFMTFEATGFPPEILRDIHYAGFSCPTPIQAQTWPIALQSRDIVAIAKTGSGKTLGYLIPAFILLRQRKNNPQHGPTVLVLAPTRELATQIQEEALKFGRSSRVSCTCLYGGAPKTAQLKELERGADIVVATPGRLNDILEMRRIDFRQVSLLVLDEADRMLDMGFEPQIRKIVNEIPPRRQTLMYTATWPKEVRKIASDLLMNPVQVNIGSVDELVANKAITQYVEVVPHMEKERRLEQILRAQEWGSKVIIFCSTKKLCDQLARSLGRNFGAAAIHGDKSQSERDWVLNQFRSGKSPILVATDVAARGLDIKDIRVVVNYDFPTGIEDYVHRIGRTGRAGATGVAYTFLSEQDCKRAPDLIKVLEGTNQHVPPALREMALRGGPSFSRDRGGMGRFDSPYGGGGRWDSGGRGGMIDGTFSDSGGIRGTGFGGRGGMRDSTFGGRGGMRDGGFSGRGGMTDGGFGVPGGRGDSFSGRGNRGRGFGGPVGGHGGWSRNDRGLQDRRSNFDVRGRGRGRGRFDNRRDVAGRGRKRSYSRSPERFHTRRYSRSRSHSRSRSRSWSRSRSRSCSRSRSWSRGSSRSPRRSYSRSPDHSRSQSRGHSRSRSRSYDRYERRPELNSDQKDVKVPEVDTPHESGLFQMSPGTQGNAFSGTDQVDPLQAVGSSEPVPKEVGADPVPQTMPES